MSDIGWVFLAVDTGGLLLSCICVILRIASNANRTTNPQMSSADSKTARLIGSIIGIHIGTSVIFNPRERQAPGVANAENKAANTG